MLLTLTSTLLSLVLGLCKQNTSCRLKTYSVPCIPSTYCSHIEVSISVNEIENEESDFNITLIAYNMDPSSNHQVSFKLNGQTMSLEYICLKLELGETSAFVNDSQKWLMTGSSIYMNGNLICTWIEQPFTFKHSPYDIKVLQDSVYNANYNLKLALDEVESVVTQDSTQLPWYQLGFTRLGGYQIYGNNQYQLIIKKKISSVQFWIGTYGKTPEIVRVLMTHEKSSFLVILCNYSANFAGGYSLNIDGAIGSVTDDTPMFSNIVGKLCSVDLPDTFICKKGYCSVWDSTFDLQIDDSETIGYSLSNVRLKESTSVSISSCEDIFILSSFIVTSLLIIIALIYYISSKIARKWVSIDT